MSTADLELIKAVRAGLARVADPVKAPAMRRYVKSELPLRGVQKPQRAELTRALFAEHPLPGPAALVATAGELWRTAEFREERYVAIDLTGYRAYAAWQTVDLLPLYEEFVVTGAWWDLVDEVAIRRVGPILRSAPDVVTPLLREWSADENRWRRRTSVICQIGARRSTDTELLRHCVESTLDDKDFFLRKGIGWALREYAKTDPDWVRDFVRTHPGLSPLSQREALKNIGP